MTLIHFKKFQLKVKRLVLDNIYRILYLMYDLAIVDSLYRD